VKARASTTGKYSHVFVGCIINVASLLGVKGGKGSAAYAASKAGIIGLSIAIIKGYSIF
jgi:NAD(P)-dependent dehydrogenase (short-subunit alcohol dehydrogenase family)